MDFRFVVTTLNYFLVVVIHVTRAYPLLGPRDVWSTTIAARWSMASRTGSKGTAGNGGRPSRA